MRPRLALCLERIALLALLACLACIVARAACAQESASRPTPTAADATQLCGQPIAPPAALPPAGSEPVVFVLGLCFDKQGNASSVDPQSYLYYIQLRPSRPSLAEWIPFGADTREIVRADVQRLWNTGFLDDISVEATDYVFENGVVGKVVTYHLEERPRIKIASYQGSKALDSNKVDETLREHNVSLKLDAFLDAGAIRRATAVVRDVLADKGYVNATVSHQIAAVDGSSKRVNVIFTIDDGPRTAIRDVAFVGNTAVRDAALEGSLKDNRPQGLLSLVSSQGRYQEAKYAEDATRVEDYYRDHGYIQARVGQAALIPLDDSPDGKTRYVQLRIPVHEGPRHKVGEVSVAGNTLLPADVFVRALKLKTGDWYSEGAVREAIRKAQESYGAAGYIEFTAFPDLSPVAADPADRSGAPRVNLVLRVTEGPQYFVHRITFTGNTTTKESVIRREFGLVEGSVFNTEMLKYSVKRLNQLGYFKPIDDVDNDVKIDRTTAREHGVDVTVKVEEQNRNAVQFGLGMSQYEGFYGSGSFTTTNFLGRGESLSLQGQKGSRSSIYQVSFTEPYIFGRPISLGGDVYSRKYDFLTGEAKVGYSEVRSGISATMGRPLFRFSRAYVSYAFEVIDTSISPSLLSGLNANASIGVPLFNPYLDSGRHNESRVTPSFTHNTIDNPVMPRSGRRITFTLPVAGSVLGGDIAYVKPELEVVQYIPISRRMALGVRASGGMLRPYGTTSQLPYYLRYFLGGEYQIRGVDLRTVGPTDKQNRALGGDRFVLFNAEYYINLAGPLRAVLFHDAGQAFAESDPIDLRQLRTSSGIEFRAMVPMLNVPFRLIYAWNVYRDTFQPARAIKFSVGTTF